MTLKGKVISIISGEEFIDGKQRVAIKFQNAQTFFDVIRVPNNGNLTLDQEVTFEATL
jgi:hypothetical protein